MSSFRKVLQALCFIVFLAFWLPSGIAHGVQVTSLVGSPTQLTITTFNVENLDPKKENVSKVDDRSARNVDDDVKNGKFTALANQIVTNLEAPDIIALQEVQDNDGAELSSVVDATLTANTLISSIQSVGGAAYEYQEIPPQNGLDGGQPGGNIRVGFLFNPQRVKLQKLERFADDSAFLKSRKPLVGEFTFNDIPITLINNHFASKSGGAGSNSKRIEQATIVNKFVENRLTTDPNANIVVLGDLNDTPDSQPIKILEGNQLKNLVNKIPQDDRFSYVFRGNKEQIDQILITPNLFNNGNPEINAVHVNAGISRLVSDHDPVIARFTLSVIGETTPIPSVPVSSPEPPVTPGTILSGVTGDDLLEKLDSLYSPRASLGYGSARDLLYTKIDNQGGIVTDIYAGYSVPIDPNSDKPREEAAQRRINAEHVWPQSVGAEGPAKSDLHNLFASRVEVNSDRANFPFADIPDNQTTSWYLDDDELSFKPSPQDIDKYSEFRRGFFEPREAKKGDIARVIFYFRTVYPELANASFFEAQKDTLCKWQADDPIDAGEVARSHAIAKTPQGNDNPFVLDSTLPQRTYCN
ncbi:endonuclease [Nostoc sp. 'Peltigera malacea cyanobiont' DB3992]|uniref:endonuclease n=1 Tax=Nostoc sp. 'Peltigera malacea cyanobiont' DB3992 TaxID=1206980 RepID=UPI000C042331|nr:endonuclease [Nostoc sp. 'Peltigera malacea cyanobiont' DB3992]PHM08781.1 endonuclease I [Nostoc sp. 'Peltigera malacea cyanobiont' DB3992]